MLEMQGISPAVLENAKLIFGSAQYVVQPDVEGKIVDRIWLFPLFSSSWAGMKPFDRIEDEKIDIAPMEERIKQALAADNDTLMGFAFIESYWAENPKAQMYFGFFDKDKHMTTRLEVYTKEAPGGAAWQLFPDLVKQRMFDEPFEHTSRELQDIALTLTGNED